MAIRSNLTGYLEHDLASFAKTCHASRSCQRLLDVSYAKQNPFGRTWACLYQGAVYTTSADRCMTGLVFQGCGICQSPPDRKDSFHRMVLTYNLFYRPSLDACILLNCQDAPHLFLSEMQSGRLGVSYTGSPFSVDIPFPDYSTWEQYPQWLLQLEKQPPTPWREKMQRIVLVGGGTRNSHLRRVIFGGTCDHAFNHTGFIDMAGVPKGKNASFGPRNSSDLRRLAFVPRLDLCRYKVIVLSEGHSRWLDHMKNMLLCKSLIVMLTSADEWLDTPEKRNAVAFRALNSAYGTLDRLLESDVTHVEIRLNHSMPDMCSHAAHQLKMLLHRETEIQAIGARGEAAVRDHFSMQAIYDYVDMLFQRLAAIQRANRVNVSAFINQHGGVEVTHENYDEQTKRPYDARLVKWRSRPPAGNYEGWHGAEGARVAVQALQELVKRPRHII